MVLWTSFEHHLPLARVLDEVGAAFAPQLEASGVDWAAVTDPAVRRDCVRAGAGAVPVLWVWDNVEPVAGFPAGTRSAWTAPSSRSCAEFLRELAARTRAKVLLTSPAHETAGWATVPMRVGLPPMPMRERLQLAHALVASSPRRHPRPWEVDWRPC